MEGVEVEQNAINFYYYKNVTLTANSNKEAVYNGETQRVEGYTTSADTAAAKVAFEGLTATAEGVNYAAEGYMVLFNIENPVGLVDVTQKYIVTQGQRGPADDQQAACEGHGQRYQALRQRGPGKGPVERCL